MINFIICIVVLGMILIHVCAVGQKLVEINIKNISGMAIGGINTTPNEVINNAIKNSKIEALRKAGIGEEINTFNNLYKNETNNKYEEVLLSDIFTTISGTVSKIDIIDTVAQFDSNMFFLKFSIRLNATVLKYKNKEDNTLETKLNIEPYKMIIGLLKNLISYAEKIEYKSILDRIFSISLDERLIKTLGFSLVSS